MNIADRMCVAMPEWRVFPKVNVDNVVAFLVPDWFGRAVDPEKDMPNVAPPWEDVVFFWTYPKNAGDLAGIEVLAYCHAERIKYTMADRGDGQLDVSWSRGAPLPHEFDASVGWRVEMEFYDSDDRFKSRYLLDPKVYLPKAVDGGWPIRVAAFVDAEGRLIAYETGITEVAGPEVLANKELQDWIDSEVRGLATIVLMATSFVHCKNVTLEEQVPNPKLAKKQLKKRGVPRFSYRVLVIEPMRKVLRDEGGMGGGKSLGTALHICRGHFKNYRDGNGLFGKYQGLYWWEQTIRGSKKAGLAQKDYEVRVGAQDVKEMDDDA